MDDLCSATIFSSSDAGSGSKDGCSVDLSSSCLAVEPASGPCDDDREGHPDHLYDMSSLMAQLPQIRRGLSRFYDGKSRSFRSLGSVKAVEDLPEPEHGRRTSKGNGCRKQTIDADMHGCSKTSRVIRKATRNVRPPSRPRSPSDGWCLQDEELRMRRCLL